MIEDNFSRGIPIVHGECYRRYRHNHVFLKVMFYKGNCYDDDSPEGRKGRSCYFITRGPLMSIAPAGGPPWYYSMWSHHQWWGFVKHQKFVIFLFQSRLGPVLWIACLLAIAKQRNWSRNPLAASAIPWGRLGTKTCGSRNCVFSFTFTFSWNTQHNRRMATRDRDQLRCFHHKVGLWNLQSSYVLLCWFVFNSVSQEYVCPFRQGQGRRDFKWGTCKG